MKRNVRKMRKYLLLVACIALVAGLAIGGTIAWLADSTQVVTNTFTPSDVDVDLTENEREYHMVPGKELPKNPTVKVTADSEKCWVFVTVEKTNNPDSYLDYTIDSGWSLLEDGVYYRLVENTNAEQSFAVLTGDKVTVKTSVTKSMMDGLGTDSVNYPKLAFKAYAIQYEGFESAADTAEAKKAAATLAWDQIKKENFGGTGFTGVGANQ